MAVTHKSPQNNFSNNAILRNFCYGVGMRKNQLPGFICKQCEGPSPIGVGYVGDYTETAYKASVGRTACPCGYSQLSVTR